jgi:hypothetical protein
MPKDKEGAKKVLWGKEFDVVKNGLSEEQVVKFVTELINKYKVLSEQKDHFVTMGTISERAAIEADKAATDIKERAKQEAEAEAERIIAEANQKARDIGIEAIKKAQLTTKQEIDDIMNVANQRAAILETESKQKTQLFLIKRRREIQDQLKEEIKKAYNQLLSGLQDLLGKGQEVESEWKNKTVELWGSKVFTLDWHDVMPPSIGLDMTNGAPARVDMDAESTSVEESIADAPIAETAESTPIETGTEDSPATATTKQEVLDIEIPTMEELSEVVSNNGAEAATDEIVDIPAEATPADEEAIEGSKNNKDKKKKKSKDETKQEKYLPKDPKGEEIKRRGPDTSKMYEGEIELTIVPPVGLALLSEIHNELDKISEAKVLQTVGSWDKSTSIKVLLEKPMPLAQILTRIPGVEMDQEMTEKGDYKSSAIKNMGKQGIEKYIALRTSSSSD